MQQFGDGILGFCLFNIIGFVIAYTPGTYIGCFVDQISRTLPNSHTYSLTMTTELCATLCCTTSSLMTYIGTEAHYWCFCGDQSNTSTFESSPNSECNTFCYGDSSQICGGVWRLSIYEVDCSTSELTTNCISNQSNQTLTPTELNEKLVKLKKEIAIDEKDTSSFKNKKRCAPDRRESSRNIGYLGIIFLSLPFVFIVMNDFLRIFNK